MDLKLKIQIVTTYNIDFTLLHILEKIITLCSIFKYTSDVKEVKDVFGRPVPMSGVGSAR